jgi:hypothetical protein
MIIASAAAPVPLNELRMLRVELTCALHDRGIVLLRLIREFLHGLGSIF